MHFMNSIMSLHSISLIHMRWKSFVKPFSFEQPIYKNIMFKHTNYIL